MRGGLAEWWSEIKHVPRHNIKLARGCRVLKPWCVFVSSTLRFNVLLMIYMVDSQTHFDQSPRVDLRPIKKGDGRVRFIVYSYVG